MTSQPDPTAALTDDELHALDLTADLANAVSRIIGGERTGAHDWAEMAAHIHCIQHAIMAQAAARAYPDRFRLLGGTV
jgi:hypothetical protein